MVHLVERLVANIALVSLLSAVGKSVVLVVALLMKTLSTELALEWLVPIVYPHVGVQGGTPVEGLSTHLTFVRLLVGVDYLVPAQGRRLPEAFSTNLSNKKIISRNLSHQNSKTLQTKGLAPVCTGMCLVRL